MPFVLVITVVQGLVSLVHCISGFALLDVRGCQVQVLDACREGKQKTVKASMLAQHMVGQLRETNALAFLHLFYVY